MGLGRRRDVGEDSQPCSASLDLPPLRPTAAERAKGWVAGLPAAQEPVIPPASLKARITLAGVTVIALVLLGLDVFFYLSLRARLTRFLDDVLRTRVQLVEEAATDLPPEALPAQLMEFGIPALVQLPDGSERRVDPLTPRFGESPPGPLSTVPAPMVSQEVALPRGGRVVVYATRAGVDATLRRLLVLEAFGTGAGIAIAALLFRRAAEIALGPMDRLVSTARAIAAGQTGQRLRPDRPNTEIGRMAVAFDEMLDALEQALEQARATEAMERELRHKLEAHARFIVRAQEAERRRIARELHDEIGQSLTGLKLSLDKARGLPEEPLRTRVEEAEALASQLQQQVHDLSLELRPQMLDDFGLLPSLLWLSERYTDLTGIDVTFHHMGLERRLPPDVESAAFRIVQEALTNAARHAETNELLLVCRLRREELAISVEDEGVGFEPENRVRGLSTGLASMEERARGVGGALRVESSPGRGTRVIATLPTTNEINKRSELQHDQNSSG